MNRGREKGKIKGGTKRRRKEEREREREREVKRLMERQKYEKLSDITHKITRIHKYHLHMFTIAQQPLTQPISSHLDQFFLKIQTVCRSASPRLIV